MWFKLSFSLMIWYAMPRVTSTKASSYALNGTVGALLDFLFFWFPDSMSSSSLIPCIFCRWLRRFVVTPYFILYLCGLLLHCFPYSSLCRHFTWMDVLLVPSTIPEYSKYFIQECFSYFYWNYCFNPIAIYSVIYSWVGGSTGY